MQYLLLLHGFVDASQSYVMHTLPVLLFLATWRARCSQQYDSHRYVLHTLRCKLWTRFVDVMHRANFSSHYDLFLCQSWAPMQEMGSNQPSTLLTPLSQIKRFRRLIQRAVFISWIEWRLTTSTANFSESSFRSSSMLRRTTCQKNDRLNNTALEAKCFAHSKLSKRKFSRNFLRSFLGWECDATHGVSTGLKTQYGVHVHKVSFMTAVPDGNERQSLCCLLNEISLAIQPNVFIATSSNLDLYHSWCCSDCGDVIWWQHQLQPPDSNNGQRQYKHSFSSSVTWYC